MENGSGKRNQDISPSDVNSESQKRRRFNEVKTVETCCPTLSLAPSSSNGNKLNVENCGSSSKVILDLIARRGQLLDHLCSEVARPLYLVSAVEDGVESVCEETTNDEVIDLIDDHTVAINSAEDKGVYVGTDDGSDKVSDENSDGLGDIWAEMNMALESMKDPTEDALFDEDGAGSDNDCEHLFILKDDIGEVCRICGRIRRGIDKIIEYNFRRV